MNLSDLANIFTLIGVIAALSGTLIFYFGRIILKSRKEITKDITSEILSGLLFVIDCLIIPGIIVYASFFTLNRWIIPFIHHQQGISLVEFMLLFFKTGLIAGQYIIDKHYEKKLGSPKKTKRFENYLSSIFIITITTIFIVTKDWFYLATSLALDVLIYTSIATRDHFRDEKNNRDNKWLLIQIKNKKQPIKAQIKRLGDEFMDIITEKQEEISLNKSEISFVKNYTS